MEGLALVAAAVRNSMENTKQGKKPVALKGKEHREINSQIKNLAKIKEPKHKRKAGSSKGKRGPGKKRKQAAKTSPVPKKQKKTKKQAGSPQKKAKVEVSGHEKSGLTVPRKWRIWEDESLRMAVTLCGGKHWKRIAELVPGRNHVQCLQRWKKVLKPGLVKGTWSADEDRKLVALYEAEKKSQFERLSKSAFSGSGHNLPINKKVGPVQWVSNWGDIASKVEGRTAKQCRERWCNHLDPAIKRGNWTASEDLTILSMQAKLGNKWAKISSAMEGRTENAVKIRWKSLTRDVRR